MDTRRTKHFVLIATLLAMLFALLPAVAADGDKTTVKGVITAIDGDNITVKDEANASHTFAVTSSTVYKKRKGLTGKILKDKVDSTAMMPGLRIVADLTEQGGNKQATAVSFRSEDMRTAQQVEAGTAPTAARVDAMGKRMDDFGTYEAIATADVLFASGSTSINAKGKSDLNALADKAKQTKDYRVVLQGFTDSTGNAAANQKLSKQRATAVANFLQEQAGLSPGRVQEGDGMGVAPDAGSGDNAGARKVTAKLVVDKGVEDGAKTP
jgi:OmpA-OmpF porin, OOP family